MVKLRALLALSMFCGVFADVGAAPESARHVTSWDLATLTDIEGLSVSPDGRWAAFQVRRADPKANGYDQAWYTVPTAGGAPRRVADGGEPMSGVIVSDWMYGHGALVVSAPVWSPDSQWLIHTRQDHGRIQLWRSHIDGKRSEQLTHNDGDVHSPATTAATTNRIALARDGRRLFFTTRFSEAQLDAALAAEARTGFLFDDRFLPASSSRPRGLTGGGALTLLWIYDFENRSERRATTAEAEEYAALLQGPAAPPGRTHVRGSVVASPGGSRGWAEARDPQLQGRVPPKTLIAQLAGANEPAICDAAVCTSQRLTLEHWRNDKELLFTLRTAERPDERILYAWEPGVKAAPREILRTRGVYEHQYNWDCAMAQDRLVCFFEELNRPRRLVAIDLDRGAIETIYDPNPQWAQFDLGPQPRAIRIRLPSGPQGLSFLVLPPDYRSTQRLPLIINAYSCSDFYDMRGAVGDEYPVFPFAAQGFAVLCHNLLLADPEVTARDPSGGMPPQFGPNDGDAFMKRIQSGLDTAVEELDRMGIIDPERVAITGLSLGGQTVEYALIHMRHISAAISSGSHLQTSLPYTADAGGRAEFRAAGFDSSKSARFDTRSISRNTDRIRAPLLMNVSDVEFETESAVALQAAGRAVEMFVYPGEFHIKNQPVHRLAIYNRNIDWMNFWLRGVESGLSGDEGQYERWRIMRDRHCRVMPDPDKPWFCRQPIGGPGSLKEVPARKNAER